MLLETIVLATSAPPALSGQQPFLKWKLSFLTDIPVDRF